MTKINQDFTMYQGESKEITITVVDADDNPLDMTGATPQWVMMKRAKDPIGNALVNKTPTLIDINGTNDGLRIVLTPSDTASIVSGVHYHEARITDASGDETIVTEGRVTLHDSPTA